MSEKPYILYIPDVALEKVFSFLSYDEIAKNRIVCRKFNEIGSHMLSRGFIQLEKRLAAVYKRVKSLLPRRESERKSHPLARHCDILQGVETRMSMLNMTYMKYIESNLLCFIPGKVLDEVINILNLIESDFTPPRTHQLLQELRDLSSMAMEHFDEYILPRVRGNKDQLEQRNSLFSAYAIKNPTSTIKGVRPVFIQKVTDMQKVKKLYRIYKHQVAYINENTQKLHQKINKQNAILKAQSMKLKEQERKIQEQAIKIQEQETTLTDIKKHLDEWSLKYKDLTTELIRAKDDILAKPSTSPKTTMSTITRSLSPPISFKSTIKPRTAQVLPKSYLQMDLERKRKSNLLPDIPIKIRNIEPNEGTKADSFLQFKDNDVASTSGLDSDELSKRLFCLFANMIPGGVKSRKRKITEDIDLQ